jgi:hypothetical protein
MFKNNNNNTQTITTKKKKSTQKILEVEITSPLKDAVRITSHTELNEKRLRGGCTSLMYACQQGLTDRVIEKVHTEVKRKNKKI